MNHISKKKLVAFAVALVVGVSLGNLGGQGGGYFIPNAGIALGFGGFILVVLAFVALVLAKQPDGNGGPGARTTLLITGLFIIGFGGGWVGAMIVRGPAPVQLEALGSLDASLEGLPGYASQGDAPALCRSEFGSEAIQSIEADTAGRIATATVYVSLSMSPPDHPGILPFVTVRVTPAVEGPGLAPSWGGSVEVVEADAGSRSGRMAFTRLTLDGDASGGGQPAGWPLELSGSLTWSCGEWSR
jgi:hypothetical protein